MANWCYNTVVFKGKTEVIEQIQQLFQTMKSKEKTENQGQLPDFIAEINGGWFFNVYWNEGDSGIFQYETKWAPNMEVIRMIAARYQVDSTQDYEEMGNLVYGRATFSEGIFTDIYLEEEDFDSYQFDESKDSYHFEGETYESEYDILETILGRKISEK
ncbi:MAG: hypothetical protein RSF68_10165 [Myroides sp.]